MEIFTLAGAFLILLATLRQARMDLEEIWGYQEAVHRLDPEGEELAKPQGRGEGYENPAMLPWIPSGTHELLREKSPSSTTWYLMSTGAAFVFGGAIPPSLSSLGLSVEASSAPIVAGVGGLLGILIVFMVIKNFMKDARKRGAASASQDFSDYVNDLRSGLGSGGALPPSST